MARNTSNNMSKKSKRDAYLRLVHEHDAKPKIVKLVYALGSLLEAEWDISSEDKGRAIKRALDSGLISIQEATFLTMEFYGYDATEDHTAENWAEVLKIRGGYTSEDEDWED